MKKNPKILHAYTFIITYPKNDLNVYDDTSANLKFALSTNSSTRILVKLPSIICFWVPFYYHIVLFYSESNPCKKGSKK
jgi:hypothetical protein